jgi:hypothetical protein
MQIQLLSGTPVLREYQSTMPLTITQLQRMGVLVGMKINFEGSAEKLRWGYMKQESLRARGLQDSQIRSLKSKLREAEELYEKLGGQREDFAKAIVEGNGNADQAVKAEESALGEISTRPEEKILMSSPAQLLADLKAAGLGSTAESNQNAEAFSKASTTLSRISSIASGISAVSSSLATITAEQTVENASPNASIKTTPEKQAGLSSWLKDHQQSVMAGGALLLAGLFITGMKPSKKDAASRKTGSASSQKTIMKKTTRKKTSRKPKSSKRTPASRQKRKKSTSTLGIIELG